MEIKRADDFAIQIQMAKVMIQIKIKEKAVATLTEVIWKSIANNES